MASPLPLFPTCFSPPPNPPFILFFLFSSSLFGILPSSYWFLALPVCCAFGRALSHGQRDQYQGSGAIRLPRESRRQAAGLEALVDATAGVRGCIYPRERYATFKFFFPFLHVIWTLGGWPHHGLASFSNANGRLGGDYLRFVVSKPQAELDLAKERLRGLKDYLWKVGRCIPMNLGDFNVDRVWD